MKRPHRAALPGGLALCLGLAFGAPPADAAADPKVEAELSRLIAGYVAAGQEDMDKLSEEQQKQLATCAADALGELPADDMTVLTTGQDFEEVIDALGQRLEQRAAADAGRLRGCFDTASAQIEAAGTGTTDAPAMTAAPTAEGIDGELLMAMEQVLRDNEPQAESAAVFEMMACMQTTLMPAMSEDEKRRTIDTDFSEEIGQELAQAHPAEFDAFNVCGEAVVARYE